MLFFVYIPNFCRALNQYYEHTPRLCIPIPICIEWQRTVQSATLILTTLLWVTHIHKWKHFFKIISCFECINIGVINHPLIIVNMSSKHEIIKPTPIYDKTEYHPVVARAVFSLQCPWTAGWRQPMMRTLLSNLTLPPYTNLTDWP